MKDSIFNNKNKALIIILSILSIYALFFVGSHVISNDLIFPNPNQILNKVLELLKLERTYSIIGHTFLRLLGSIIISFIIGMILGILAGLSRKIELFLRPYIIIFRTVPVAAIIVLLVLFMSRTATAYAISALMLIPIVYEAFKEGLKNLDKDLMEVWRLDTSLSVSVIRIVFLPMIFPFIKTAFLQSVGLGFKVLIMAEFIAYSDNSIGKEISSANNRMEYDIVMAWTLIVVLLVVIVELLPKLVQKIIYKFKK